MISGQQQRKNYQNSVNRHKRYICAMLCCFCLGTVHAETHTFTASVRFISPLTLSNTVNPDLGTFATGPSGRNYILGTDGSISGTDANDYVGGASAGSMIIRGSATQKIDIVAQNLTDDGGVSIANVICNYDGNGDTDCSTGITAVASPSPAGTSLLIGMDINTTTSHADGDTASPSFDIVVSYN